MNNEKALVVTDKTTIAPMPTMATPERVGRMELLTSRAGKLAPVTDEASHKAADDLIAASSIICTELKAEADARAELYVDLRRKALVAKNAVEADRAETLANMKWRAGLIEESEAYVEGLRAKRAEEEAELKRVADATQVEHASAVEMLDEEESEGEEDPCGIWQPCTPGDSAPVPDDLEKRIERAIGVAEDLLSPDREAARELVEETAVVVITQELTEIPECHTRTKTRSVPTVINPDLVPELVNGIPMWEKRFKMANIRNMLKANVFVAGCGWVEKSKAVGK